MSFRALVFRNALLVPLALSVPNVLEAQRSCPASVGPATAAPRDENVLTIQPRVMVVPYVRTGQDRRTVLEDDFDLRVAVTVIRDAFDQEGFTTVDFNAASTAGCGACSSAAQESQLRTILMAAGPDVYVLVEFRVTRDERGTATVINLTTHDVSTSNSLASALGRSGPNLETDVTKHLEAGLAASMPKLLGTMNDKWTDFLSKGKPVKMEISMADGALINFESLVGPSKVRLADQVSDWFKCNAWRGYYNIASIGPTSMTVPDVRIPLRDDSGTRVFTADDFARKLADFLRSIGVTTQRNMLNSTMFITLK